MPSLQRARRQAKAVACQKNLREWSTMFATQEVDTEVMSWIQRIIKPRENHHYDNATFLCPMATKLGTQINPTWWSGSKFSAWGRKSNNHKPFACSYGLNYRLESQFIKSASSVPVLFDCTNLMACLLNSHSPPPNYDDISVLDANAVEYPGRSICINRHDGGINMLFADYSVRKVGLKELWTLKWHGDFKTTGPWTKAGGVKPEDWPKWMRRFKDY